MITDEEKHKAAKRPIANAYAMTTLLDYEPYVDATSTLFVERLTTLFARENRSCDFGQWIQWYAFDVIGEMTFGQRLGFLEQGKDVAGLIKTLHRVGWYSAVVGQMPFLDLILDKNVIMGKLELNRKASIARFVAGFMQRRITEEETTGDITDSKAQVMIGRRARTDFLSKFVAAAESHEGKIPTSQLFGWSMSNISAGSDTTAITLRAIFCESVVCIDEQER
jgi:cytochrome P450